MKGIVEGIARGREKKHEVIGSPILFTARWLHVITKITSTLIFHVPLVDAHG